MITRYLVALCLVQVYIVQTIAQATGDKTKLRNATSNKSNDPSIWDAEKILLGQEAFADITEMSDNDRIESVTHEINKEPFTVDALTPKPLLDAVAEMRNNVQTKLFEAIEDGIKKVGAKQLIDGALGKVEAMTKILFDRLKALYNVGKREISRLGNYVDKMFEKRLAALYKHLDGKCFLEDEESEYELERLTIFDAYPRPDRKDTEQFLKSLGLTGRASFPGAICINVKGLIGARYQTDGGVYLEAQTGIGIDAGVTMTGDVRISGNAGIQVSLGQDEIEEVEDERLIPKSSTKKKNKALENIKDNTSLSYRGEAGVKVYFPSSTDTMNGWGGFDIGFTLKALPDFDGLSFHIRHPWYSCKNFLDHTKWVVTGFTINYFSFKNYQELYNGTRTFPGFSEVITNLKDAFDINNWEEEKGFSLTVGAYLSVGISNTARNWNLDSNFRKQPYAGGHAQCPRRRVEETEEDDLPESTEFETLVSVVRQSTKGRILSTSANSAVRDVMGVLIQFLGKGGIKIPYCFGECSRKDSNKYLKGAVTIEPPDDCDGVSIKADAKEITLANVGFLILNGVNPKLANLISGNLGGFGKLGIKSPSITLEVTTYPKISITVTGSPQLPSLPSSAKFEKLMFDGLKKIIEGLTLEVSATLQSTEFAEMGFKVSGKPVRVSNSFQIQDTDGNGFSVFTTYKLNGIPVPTSQILEFGMNVPMRICTAKCSKRAHEQEVIFLNGEISTKITVGEKPSLTMGGVFSMKGTWNKAFALPILHISNVVAGAQFDMTKGFPPPPTELLLGGAICLGSQLYCQRRTAKYYIEAKMYLNLNVNAPEENGFIAMVSTVTIEHMLNVAGALHSNIKRMTDKFKSSLPSSLKESGIYPYNYNKKDCDPMKNATALAVGDVDYNLDCFAYVAIAPEQSVEIKEVSLTIPKGISFGGQLKFLKKFDLKAKGNIDVLTPPKVRVYIDAEMVNLKLGNFLQLGAEYKSGSVRGNARFYVDYQNLPSFKINIYVRAALLIPFINTYGSVHITVNNEFAEFRSVINFFGGIFKPNAYLKWRWDMSYFKCELGNIIFAGGILKVDHLKMEVDARGGSFKKASFSAKISVLNFLSIAGSFAIEKQGSRFKMDFRVSANLGVASGSAWGSAVLDTRDISNTRITNIDYKLDAPQWMKDAAKAIAGAVNAVGEAVSEAFNFAADVAQAVGKEIAKVGKAAIEYIGNIAKGLGNAVNAILNGDVGAAMTALADTAKKALEGAKKAVEAVARAVLNTISNIANAIGALFKSILNAFRRQKNVVEEKCCYGYTYQYDNVRCRYKRQHYSVRKRFDECWGVCHAWFSCGWRGCRKKQNCIEKCSRKYTSYRKAEYDQKDYYYHKCVNDYKAKMDTVKSNVQKAGDISKAAEATKKRNQKLLSADLNRLPSRTVSHSDGKFQGKVPGGSSTMRTTVTGSANRLDNNQRSTFSTVKDLSLSATNKIMDSLNGLENAVSSQTSKIYLTNLGGLDDKIKVINKGGWTGWINSFDNYLGADSSLNGQNGGYCGFSSYFSNYYRDRRFQFRYCTPNMKTHHKNGRGLGWTGYNQAWTKECPGNEFLSHIRSHHSNYYQDRIFDFHCRQFDGFEKGHLCKWSNDGAWHNTWRQTAYFECDDGMMLTAIKSAKSNYYHDRVFSFKCCHVKKESPIQSSSWTGYLNGYNGYLNVNPNISNRRAAICGVSSHHSNYYEDRRFKFQFCRPRSAVAYTSEQFLGSTSYRAYFHKECSGNRFVAWMKSWHNNYYQDRYFQMWCGEFSGYTRSKDVCEWVNGGNYVNIWDGEFTTACGTNMAMVAMASTMSNYYKDRLFKFKCCRMQQKINL